MNAIAPSPCPNLRHRNNFQLDEPPFDFPHEVVFRASRCLDATDVWKVDGTGGLDARGRVQIGMIDDVDGDDIGPR